MDGRASPSFSKSDANRDTAHSSDCCHASCSNRVLLQTRVRNAPFSTFHDQCLRCDLRAAVVAQAQSVVLKVGLVTSIVRVSCFRRAPHKGLKLWKNTATRWSLIQTAYSCKRTECDNCALRIWYRSEAQHQVDILLVRLFAD